MTEPVRIAFDLDGVLADFAGGRRATVCGIAIDPLRFTRDFWTTLAPLDPAVIPRLQKWAVARGWDIFFLTQRPPTRGDSVQRQTQRWLVQHGFDLPSVIVHNSSRGRLAAALDLDVLVDDTVRHCVDVVSESQAHAILVLPDPDPAAEENARRLGIAVCRNAAASLTVIEHAGGSRRRVTSAGRTRRPSGST